MLRLEDSSTIECAVALSSRKASLVLAVCSEPKSHSCKCIQTAGWSTPACFDSMLEEHSWSDSYHRATIGLGVCLAVLLVLCVLITVYVAKDCAYRSRRQGQVYKQAPSSQTASLPVRVLKLGEPTSSALRQERNPGASSSAGMNGRFSNDRDGKEKEFYQNAGHAGKSPIMMSLNQLDYDHGYHASGEGYQEKNNRYYSNSNINAAESVKPDLSKDFAYNVTASVHSNIHPPTYSGGNNGLGYQDPKYAEHTPHREQSYVSNVHSNDDSRGMGADSVAYVDPGFTSV